MDFFILVIVPVYNAEMYLCECIESIIKQTYKKIEIILVDDGSTDTSLSICKNYKKCDERVKIIQKTHSGLVATRKLGVENSSGDYCIFVDSDDTIANNLLESVIPLTGGGTVDLVNYNMATVSDTGIMKWKYTIPDGTFRDEHLKEIYTKMMFDFSNGFPGIIQSLCTKLIKREILSECIKYLDDRITMGEDAAVVYNVMLHSKAVVITNKCLYFYRSHIGSMASSKDYDIFKQIFCFYTYMQSAFSKYDDKYRLDIQLKAYMMHFIEKGIKDIYSMKLQSCYQIPFSVLNNLRHNVVLYGAGRVGNSFYKQLSRMRDIKILAWIDKNNEQLACGHKIESIDILRHINFDKIVIAVMEEKLAREIKEELCHFASDEQILWDEPQLNWWMKELEI